MAVTNTARPVADGRVFAGPLQWLFAGVVRWNDMRVTRKVLNTLSDRELDDIGLMRGDIDNFA